MKTFPVKPATLVNTFYFLMVLFLISTTCYGQTKYQSEGGMQITIEGTSNIHDWDMKSDKGTCTGVFEISNAGLVTAVSSLSFTVPAKSLKSKHKGMDKNTYKALKTNKYTDISFRAAKAKVHAEGSKNNTLTTNGELTISGVTKNIQLTGNGVVNDDNSISYTGSYKLKMTDYDVVPPRIMLGAITTGNDILVKFNLLFKTL